MDPSLVDGHDQVVYPVEKSASAQADYGARPNRWGDEATAGVELGGFPQGVSVAEFLCLAEPQTVHAADRELAECSTGGDVAKNRDSSLDAGVVEKLHQVLHGMEEPKAFSAHRFDRRPGSAGQPGDYPAAPSVAVGTFQTWGNWPSFEPTPVHAEDGDRGPEYRSPGRRLGSRRPGATLAWGRRTDAPGTRRTVAFWVGPTRYRVYSTAPGTHPSYRGTA